MGFRPAITVISTLELTMRDVLDDMADLAAGFAWRSTEDTFEILVIEPTDTGRRVPDIRPVRGKGAVAGR